MPVRDVLDTANREIERVSTTSFQVNATATTVVFRVRLTEAQRQNPDNRFDFHVYGSLDNFATRTYLGGVTGWQGGVVIDKRSGLEVAKAPPAIILEATPSLREMAILCEVECHHAVRFGVEAEDT